MPDDKVTAAVPDIVSVLPLRGAVVFPHAVVPLAAGRASSVRLVEDAVQSGRVIAAVLQRDPTEDAPDQRGLHPVGTLTLIHKVFKQPDGSLRLVVQGIGRVRLVEVVQTAPFLRARVEPLGDDGESPDMETEALARSVTSLFQRVVALSPTLPDELVATVSGAETPGALADVVTATLPTLALAAKQELLETAAVKARLQRLVTALGKEAEVLELGSKIQSEVHSEMSKTQREYYLREQLKAIQKELGESDDRTQEIDALREKIEAAGMPEEANKEALRELDRLAKMPPAAAEYTVARTYIDWLVSVPWKEETVDDIDLVRARAILDEDHEGLDKVKDRILEYLAVKKTRPGGRDPILCFVGPPGVGKTSLGKSIARALGREFVRVSLGGVRDEAEIRGHRRTYVGALPGRIIQGIKQAGTSNPVFMMDEVDKVGMDFRGDPSAALLEVLDPEQNNAFTDHYLGVPFDLSEVMFITTANLMDPILSALRDRMEIIGIPGYTEEEKLGIAQKYLIPRQLKEHGITEAHIEIDEPALRQIVSHYTREAGVRNLEREIANVMRKVAKKIAEGKVRCYPITTANLHKFLGVPKFIPEAEQEKDEVGVCTGLAWTEAGGDVLYIEATSMKGKGLLTLTGHLGDVMKESAQAALSYVRSRETLLGIDPDLFAKTDIHIHVPAGAIPKDGPSAGITMATALASLLANVPVRRDVAMTGEITLRGRVLPIGGLKEKILAAKRAKLSTVILPKRNEKDLEEIPKHLLRGIRLVFAETMDDVIKAALRQPSAPRAKPARASKRPPTKQARVRRAGKSKRTGRSRPLAPAV
ncbi:MAG: endopeptidase La [Candidatus Rokubacteria bacterium]|nr:endopeptidase La [Candidatus Rokubacteria bacterium]